MKKGMTVKKLAEELKKEFSGKTFSACTRRNGKVSDGWARCVGAGATRAVKLARLPWNHFWSGSAPTPSTQYPQEIAEFIRKIAY